MVYSGDRFEICPRYFEIWGNSIHIETIMQEIKSSKSFIRPDNTAVLTCPHCNNQKVILADAFKGKKHKLKVKCICSQKFIAHLEFRKHVRKDTVLKGSYSNHSHESSRGDLIIQDISLSGLSFTSLDIENFKPGDEFNIVFHLNDEHRTEIKKDVIVRNIRQRIIGCEFDRPEDVYGGPLGYYIVNVL